jgi:hypothetical protein
MVFDELMEEQPLRDSHYTILRLVKRRELGFYGVIRIVRHLQSKIQSQVNVKGILLLVAVVDESETMSARNLKVELACWRTRKLESRTDHHLKAASVDARLQHFIHLFLQTTISSLTQTISGNKTPIPSPLILYSHHTLVSSHTMADRFPSLDDFDAGKFLLNQSYHA